MSKEAFDIEALRLWPGLIITVVSFSIAILSDVYLLPDKGKIVGFAISASLLAIYTARPVLRYSGAKAFIIGYILLHIALIFIPLTDSSFPGLALVPFFMAVWKAKAWGLSRST